jgi:hypothetical protein
MDCRLIENKKRVYIFGAGASRDLHFTFTHTDADPNLDIHVKVSPQNCFGPLSIAFFRDADQFLKRIKNHFGLFPYTPLKRELIDYALLKGPSLCKIKSLRALSWEGLSANLSLEDLYKELNSDIDVFQGEKEAAADYVILKQIFGDYIHSVFSSASYFVVSRNHDLFAHYLNLEGGDVISLNWDTLLEQGLERSGSWKYADGYAIPVTVHNGTLKNPSIDTDSALESKTRILKPHGSIVVKGDGIRIVG